MQHDASIRGCRGARYTLRERVGAGGYSVVHKCTDELGIRYACKVLSKEKNRRDRVLNEVAVMKTLRASPKVVSFVDVSEDRENYYIVQEWCRGGSVTDYLNDRQGSAPLSENTVASIVRGTLRGLCHMHASGVVHRDIKASNVLLTDASNDADVKLGDLGAAVFCCKEEEDQEFEVRDLVGTPSFLAPENLRQVYHAKSDVWSMGVMAHHLLTGRLPFQGRDVAATWRNILADEEVVLDGRRCYEELTCEAKAFMRACMTKDVRERPAARALLDHAWLTGTGCDVRFEGPPLRRATAVISDSQDDATLTIHS